MKDYIKYIPLSLFVAFCVKMLISGASWQDAPIFAILAAFVLNLVNKEEEKQLKVINDRLNFLEKQNETKIKEMEELRSHVSSVKLGQQIKSAGRF